MKRYYVYIMSNEAHTIYVGVTHDLERRVYQHKHSLIEGFTRRYNLTKLVYYAETNDVREAITREKQIKGWLRAKKVALIEEMNPYWDDLGSAWYSDGEAPGKEADPSLRSVPHYRRCVRVENQLSMSC
jgi:putative endonuclease